MLIKKNLVLIYFCLLFTGLLQSETPAQANKETKEFYLNNVLKFLDTSKYSSEKALDSYNFLRRAEKLTEAQKINDIDRIWLVSLGQKLWEENNYDISNTLHDLLVLISDIKDQLADDEQLYDAFNAYNYLREAIGKPPALSLSDIKPVYLNALEESFKNILLNQHLKDLDMLPATSSQAEYVKEEAMKALGKDQGKAIRAGAIPDKVSCTFSINIGPDENQVLVVGKEQDYDSLIGSMYHELGHINYRTSFSDSDEKDEDKKAQLESDAQRFEDYIRLGMTVLDNSTELGRWIDSLLKQNEGFIYKNLISLTSGLVSKIFGGTSYSNQQLISRRQEMNADLFVMEKLYEQKRIEPLLALLNTLATSFNLTQEYGYIAAFDGMVNRAYQHAFKEIHSHPTDLERALAIVGFLKSKGLNVNAELRRWESEGICIPLKD